MVSTRAGIKSPLERATMTLVNFKPNPVSATTLIMMPARVTSGRSQLLGASSMM